MGSDEFLLTSGGEQYAISLRSSSTEPAVAQSHALMSRVVFELRYGLETGDSQTVLLARQILAALDGSGWPRILFDDASPAESRDLLSLVESAIQAGRLLIRRNDVQALRERSAFEASVPLPPAPSAKEEPLTASFEVKVIDDTGAPIAGIDVNLTIDGEPETLTTGGGGSVNGTGKKRNPATLRMLDVSGLAEKLEPRFSKPRSEKLPKGDDVAEVIAGKPFSPLSVKPDVPFTLILARTPRGVLEVTHHYHDDTPVEGAEYEVEFSDGSVRKGTLSEPGRLLISDAPLGSAKVRFGPDARPYERAQKAANPEYRPAMSASDVDGLIARRLAGAA
jgi:hypothetical protein